MFTHANLILALKIAPDLPLGLFGFLAIRWLITDAWVTPRERVQAAIFIFALSVTFSLIEAAIWLK